MSPGSHQKLVEVNLPTTFIYYFHIFILFFFINRYERNIPVLLLGIQIYV